MRYYKKITVLAALAVAAVGQMFAQNQSSPYSRYGYGLFSDYATSAQRNMGGVGVAMADGRQINVMNPASYAVVLLKLCSFLSSSVLSPFAVTVFFVSSAVNLSPLSLL